MLIAHRSVLFAASPVCVEAVHLGSRMSATVAELEPQLSAVLVDGLTCERLSHNICRVVGSKDFACGDYLFELLLLQPTHANV